MDLPLNLIIVIGTSIISFLGFNQPGLIRALALEPPMVRRGQHYRLVTYGLVHADLQHLLFNMITLYFFGGLTERLLDGMLGPFGYLLFYLGALAVAILPSFLRHRDDPNYLSLGASGAVSAVLFVYVLLAPWSLIFVFFLPVPAIVFGALYLGYSIYMDRRGGDNVNHNAHLWGALFGMLFVVLLDPGTLPRFFARLIAPLG